MKKEYPDYVDDEVIDEFEMNKKQEKVRKVLRNYNNVVEDLNRKKKGLQPDKPFISKND